MKGKEGIPNKYIANEDTVDVNKKDMKGLPLKQMPDNYNSILDGKRALKKYQKQNAPRKKPDVAEQAENEINVYIDLIAEKMA